MVQKERMLCFVKQMPFSFFFSLILKSYPFFAVGFELAGSVRSVGKGISRFKVGDRIMALKTGSGAFAEQCVLQKSDLIFPIPYSVDYETAAGFAVCYGTAYVALRKMAMEHQG